MQTRINRLRFLLLGALLLCVPDASAQKHSPTSAHTSYTNISMTGYQGWFGTPGDGGTNGWRHYNRGGSFRPGSATIEYWPDMREADEDERYETEFVFDDGTPATVFSSANPKTVNRHFQWMKEYGIDGAFVQRFRSDFGIRNTLTKVMANALAGAENNGRAIAVMYDISGTNIFVNGSDSASVAQTRTEIVNQIFDDWKELVDDLQLTTKGDDQAYLYHNGKPLVALWGLGFPSRHNPAGVNMDFWVDLVDKFQNDPEYGGCSIMLGVPTRWRTGGGDALSGTEHARMIDLIKTADVVMPWHTSRFARSDFNFNYRSLIAADVTWCDDMGLDYAPTISPGIREFLLNLNNYERPREGGLYFWDMARAALDGGAEALYLGMFDEIDEGTQYFKVHRNPPFYSNTLSFTDYGNNPEDHYLWLAGEATRALRGEFTAGTTFRTRADNADFQSTLSIDDSGTDYTISLDAGANGRKVFYADPYKVPDGAPTVGTVLDTCLFKNELTDSPVQFSEDQRGRYLRFVEVDAATNEVISYRAMVAVHGFAAVPYVTSFESGMIDQQFWTTGTENSSGAVRVTAEFEPQTGDYHLISTTAGTGTASTNYADLHLRLGGIVSNVNLSYAVKTLGSPTIATDGIYFSDDGGATFTQVLTFNDATNTFQTTSVTINDLAAEAGLSLSDNFVIRIQHRAAGINENGGLALDDLSILLSTERTGFAKFAGADDLTGGAWMGTYGVDGDYIVGREPNLPDYATVTWDANSSVVIWEAAGVDDRGLQYTADSTILAARTADPAQHPWSFTVDVGDRETTLFAYFVDGGAGAERQFILNVQDAGTADKYDVQTVRDFADGKWLGWTIRGKVTFFMEQLSGPGAVVSGLFFAPSAPTEIEVPDYLQFDGLDDFVDCGRDAALQISGNEITLEAWFKADTTLDQLFRSTILAMDHSEPANDQGYFLRANGNGQIGWGFGDGTWHEVASDPALQLFEPGTWNHVAGTYDGSVQKIFLNGNLIAQTDTFVAVVGTTPTEPLYLGSSPAFPDRVAGAGIAEVRIWNVARSDSEVKEFATQRITGVEPGLAAYWPINEGEGQVITDLSPNALEGIRGGTTEEDEFDPQWVMGEVGPELVDVLDGFNGSFEDDLTNWRFFEVPNSLGSTVDIITGDVVDGAKAARITFTDGDPGLVDRSLDNWDSNMPLEAGKEYTLVFWAKSESPANGVLRVTHGYFDADRSVLGEGTEVFTLTDTYQEYSFNYTPVDGTEKGWISFRWKSEDNSEFRSGIVFIDHVQVLTEKLDVATDDPFAAPSAHAELRPNYPNPFSAETTIGFSLPRPSPVRLSVLDLSGRQVATLVNQRLPAGSHQVRWNAGHLPGGTYFLLLRTNATVRTGKMILTRQ